MKTVIQHRRHALVIALAAAYALGSPNALANPNGAQVVSGQAALQTQGSQLTVTNSAGAIINWGGFSIGAGETTRFIQPSAASAVLNRVVGPDMSQLLGQLQSNGQVFLINPNGIVVGASARVDTNSFVASTLDIADADFLAGKLRFLDRSGAAGIRNEGLITAGPGGRIALIAPNIENSGIIHAPDGNILLAAGRKLEIASLDLDGIRFEIQAPTDSVLNLGKLLADNGAVRVFAGNLRNSGEIEASRMALDASGQIVLSGSNSAALTAESIVRADGASGGAVLIQSAQGTTRVDGLVSASGSAGAGGDVRLLGERVALEAGARIVASGSSAGGQILVGGDYQGTNADVQNALRVNVAAGATLEASASDKGNGGRIIVWADENTRYQGALSARGGAQGGDGGFAEVSGKQNLEFTGTADLSAPAGAHGSLLLDPLDILVSLTSGILPTIVDEFADFASNVVTVSPLTLAAVGGNVVLQAERDIYVRDAIHLTAAGAGLSATAGGALFNAGSIINTAGITTNGGAVTLRGQSIVGAGAITSNGGAVDLLTSGSLNYSSAISSGGGAVTLASQSSSVNSANVNAGSGAIGVTGSSVSSGSYTSSGTVNLTATSGYINVYDIAAGVANLSASSSVNAYVNVSDRVNATSTGSSVNIYNDGTGSLRLGTLTGNSGVTVHSSTGMAQASGGLLTSRYVNLYMNSSTATAGSAAAPILVAAPSALVQPEVALYDVAAAAHIGLVGNPTLARLEMEGTVAGLGASTVTGASNLSSLTLGAGSGVLNLSAVSTAGFANGFGVDVTNGAINASTLTLPGASVDLTATGAVTVGTMSGANLSINSEGTVNIGSATTTGSSGIYVTTQSCSYYNYVACAATSPITAGTLNAGGTGSVGLYTYDNGDVNVTSLTAGRDVTVEAGYTYQTSYSYPYTSQTTTNNIVLGTVVGGRYVSIDNNGEGNLTLTSLSAANTVNVEAGSSFSPTYNTSQTTNNTITIGNNEPVGAAGSFAVYNYGIGDLTVTGAVDRSASGGIGLSASQGAVTATGNLTAHYSISIAAAVETLPVASATLGQLVAGAGIGGNGDVYIGASGNVTFGSVSASATNGYEGNVSMTAESGFVRTNVDNPTPDVVAIGDVEINASTSIGNGAFTNPMDIQAGAAKSVWLTAGSDIGSDASRPVNIDTSGTIGVTTSGGQFHVAATDGTTARSLSTIRLSASAAGIGGGNSATFTSDDLSVTASSDGAIITIGDLVRSTGSLNEFNFAATTLASQDSALVFGNVNLTTTGFNQLMLSATNGLSQPLPVATNNVSAGHMELSGGSGAVTLGNLTSSSAGPNSVGNIVHVRGGSITAGNLSGPGIDVAGTDLTLGVVTSNGTNRGYYSSYVVVPRLANYAQYWTDELRLSASTGSVTTSGNVSSATSAFITGEGVSIAGGTGTVMGGHSAPYYYTDTVDIQSGGGNLGSGAIAAYDVSLSGTGLNTGAVTADRNLTLAATSFATGALVATSGTLNITADGAFVPSGALAMSAGSSARITAPTGINLLLNYASLTAPNVTLTSTGGDVKAELTGTSYLTLTSGGVYDVTSSATLGTLYVTADGIAAGPSSSVTANGTNQWMNLTTAGTAVGLDFKSTTAASFYYEDSSSLVTAIDITTGAGTFSSGGGRIDVSAPVADITASSVSTNNAAFALQTGGSIALTSLATGGGSVNVYSSDGAVALTSVNSGGGSVTARTAGDATRHVSLNEVLSLGGNVSITADNGNIVGVGTQPFHINTLDGNAAASGTTTLSAVNGSIGTAITPILTSGAISLIVSAQDEIAVNLANAALTNLSITTAASGSGAVSVNDILGNFAGLSVTRSGSDLVLGGLSPGVLASFALSATDGNIVVAGDISNINALSLNAGYNLNLTGDLSIQASGGARSVTANTYDLRAGRDVVIAAGAGIGENVSVSQTATSGYNYVYARRDVLLSADGGSALLGHNAAFWTQYLNAGRDLKVVGGSAGIAGASAAISSAGYQSLTTGGDLLVQGGSADGASAAISAVNSQSMTQIPGSISVLGGAGLNAFAEIASSASSQSLGSTSTATDLVLVQGGTGDGSYASIRAATSQSIQSSGDIRVLGNTGVGANAELLAGSSQTVGSTSNYFNDPTDAILVQASSGGTARIQAGSTQTIRAGGGISVLGGSGAGMSAKIETTGGGQTVGSSGTSYNDPTADILVQGGTASGAFASIKATGSQVIHTGGTISVLGNSGSGAFAEILTTGGTQTIGSTSTSSNDATDSILVQAGSGGIARIQAQSSQSIMTGGDLSVLGGTGANMTAAIQSVAGSQSIGYTYVYSNDPSGLILVQAGNATGAAASITAATGQSIDAGGTITLTGAGAGAYAEIATTSGTQTIGNVNSYYYDKTDSISLTGGSADGAYARIKTGGFQNLRTSANLTLTGGAGDDAGAAALSGTGQSITVQGALAMTGGSGSAPGLNETAIRNSTSGNQTLSVTGNMSVTGGAMGSDTWVKQSASGSQSITIGGNLALLSPAATTSTGVTSIEALGSTQAIDVGGAMTIANQAGWLTYVSATGTQSINADSLGISLSSAAPVSSPFAGVTATGNQSIYLRGDGSTVGSATLSIFNTSSLTDSLAAVSTAADQTILMDYNSAGLVQIGSTTGLGKARIFAGGEHTMVAGQLLIQGGANTASVAALMVPNDAAVISTIYGPIEIKGGAQGAALIDPPTLDMVSNNGVFLLAGPGPAASATINAGLFNLASTNGNLSLVSSAAVAAIYADVFNYFGSGDVVLNGGTITVTLSGLITINGICYSCDTNLFGPFNVFAYIPPPTDYGNLIANDLLALSDLGYGLFDAFYNENGELELRNRRLNQCY